MNWNRARWSGLAALALVGGLLTPVAMAPSAQAAPVISTTSVIAAGATQSGGVSVSIVGTNFKSSGLTVSDFTVTDDTASNLSPLGASLQPGTNNTEVVMTFSGTALLGGQLSIVAKRSAFDPDPLVDSNALTIPIVAPPAPATLTTTSNLILGSENPTVTLAVTDTQFDFGTVATRANWVVNTGTTSVSLTGIRYLGSSGGAALDFSGTVTGGTLTIQADDTVFNPAVGGRTNALTLTAIAAPPVISADGAPVTSGSVNPSITIETTSAFASTITDDSFTVTAPGTTGLSLASVADVGAGEVTLNFSGTAGNGEIEVTADASAFDPAGSAASNTLTIGLSPVIATTSTISAGAVNPTVVLTSNTSTFVGSPTVNDVDLQPITGLSVGSVTRDSSTQLTVTLAGTAPTTGTVRITALQSGFNVPGTASNTVEIAISSGGGGGGGGTPATPPSAPASAEATAGDGEVTVTWQAPTSQGSFPVTNYQVQSTPSSRGCVVPVSTMSCRIVGLRNGTAYTFQVRALNGGGWGSWATTSAVTPGPGPDPDASIMITGSRSANERVARVRGETTGLLGASVQSMLRTSDRVEFAAGSMRKVDPQGRFTWQRRINPQANLEVYFTAGQVQSNTVTIPSNR